MEDAYRTIIRSLEIQNEAKAQDLSIAYQTIENMSNPDNGSVNTIDFVRKVAESRTKFSKEAQDLVDLIDGTNG